MAILKYFNQQTQEWESVSLGQQGVQGPEGPPGVAGASAYEAAVLDGFVGTEQEWLDSLKGDLTAAEVKTRYESNVNTNAFTDVEKIKLTTIEDNAQANVQADWTAVSGDAFIQNKPNLATVATSGLYSDLSGKPTLGTAAAQNTDYFASSAQGATADAALQPGDNVSDLVNDSGFVTAVTAPVTSVASKTGAVTLVKADVGLSNVDNTSDVNKPVSNATQTVLNAKADLVDGLVPTNQIPSIAITEYLGSVANEAALLALVGQKGDWAIRSDISTTWILSGDNPAIIGNWVELATPPGGVTGVNGQSGNVVLNYSDVGAASSAQGTTADSALQPEDIGVTVQGYSADTVIDANYVATEESYTTVEKSKLAGIEGGAQVNVATDLSYTAASRLIISSTGTDATLPEVVASGNSGLMTGADKNKLDGIETGATADQTSGEIKTLYEANLDTNAFTDAEKTKLSGIAAGAQVNVPTDLTYTAASRLLASSTGADATLPEVIAAGTSGLMTGADKTKLDAITGTNTGDQDLSSYQVKPTEGAFVDGDKNKLDGIAAGAEVNVQSDWTAPSGDAHILNKPTLATVAISGAYTDLSGLPTLGTVAATAITDYATAAQGTLAGTALQPTILTTNGDLITRVGGLPSRLGVGTEGQVLTSVSGIPAWADSAGGGATDTTETITVMLSDNVTPVGTGTSIELITLRYNFTVTGVWFETMFQAPSGSSAIVRVLADAVNIFTSADALTIPAASTSVGPLVPNTTFLATGTVLRFDIQQVGATNTGLGYRVTLQGTRS